MTKRQIILDTETTGLDPKQGHRLIEIGAVEMINRRFTHHNLHVYINPERPVDAGALAVHGINDAFLADKPKFTEIVDDFLAFIDGAELIIHNAAFDIGFIEHELQLAQQAILQLNQICQITDTLMMARQLHPGQKNSLDALCKRYKVDNSHRSLHGALLDAEILGRVYLAMTGGQSSLLGEALHLEMSSQTKQQEAASLLLQAHFDYDYPVIAASPEELQAHQASLEMLQKKSNGQCVWLEEKSMVE